MNLYIKEVFGMISKALELFASGTGLKAGENSVFGIYGDFFINVTETKTKKTAEFSCYVGDKEQYADDYLELNDSIRDVVEKFSISDYSVNEHSVAVTSDAPVSVFSEMIDYIIGLLNEKEIPNAHFCACCGEKFKEGEKRRIVTVTRGKSETKSLLCEKCALEAAEKAQPDEQHDEETNEGNFKNGLIASVIAGVISGGLYILLFWLTRTCSRIGIFRFASCLFAVLISISVYYAFKLASHKAAKKGLIAVSAVTCVSTLLAHFFGCSLGTAAYLGKLHDIPFYAFKNAFGDLLSLQFTDKRNLMFLLLGAVVALCAAFIVIIIFWSAASKEENASAEAKVSIQTIK